MILRRGIYSQRADSETTLIPGDGTTNWVDVVGNVTTSLGKIVPNDSVQSWGSKGASFGTIPSNTDFTLEFRFVYRSGTNNTGNSMFGVSSVNLDANYTTINYAFQLFDNAGVSRLSVYENGVRNYFIGNGNYTKWNLVQIKRESGIIKYYNDNVLIYTSMFSTFSSMVFDCAIYRDLGAEDIKIIY